MPEMRSGFDLSFHLIFLCFFFFYHRIVTTHVFFIDFYMSDSDDASIR